MSKIFEKEIKEGLLELSKKIGYKKKKYFFTKTKDDNITDALLFGLSLYRKPNHTYVDITVGVAHKNVELLYTKLTNKDKNIFNTTISSQIGYLMPERNYKDWEFSKGKDNTKVFDDILMAIQTYAFPYQEKMANFENLFEAYKKREPGILHIHRDRYLPILYYLKGEKQKGLDFIKEAIERQKKPIDKKEMEIFKKLAGSDGQIIIGGGIGKVDPLYLEFAERYKALP